MNRLSSASSPYLLQHKDNPVDWQEWGPEAFDEARRRDVPILLSIGYASCHWCHVMAHESFEDVATAADLNAGFVAVKVDREERPDVDAVYMEATVAMTGHGGWPMTVFLTPDGTVFHAGTYYPPTPRQGMPSFRQLLAAVSEAWRERREEVESASERITRALADQRATTGGVAGELPTAHDLEQAVHRVATDHDQRNGGFGGAPKFPPSMVLEWLLRHAARVGTEPGTSGAIAAAMATNTLQHMASSGTYDQLEGGFARYSVDAAWVVPHFEKMLYDNALLARVYLHWWRLTGDPLGRRIALETCDFMLQRLGTGEGGLASALDADTPTGEDGHGVEGLTYVWTPAQLVEVLGPDDGAWAAQAFGVTDAGTFEHGSSTLRLLVDVDDVDAPSEDVDRWQAARDALRQSRSTRPQPFRDDKVVAAWNGLAVAALAETGALLERPDLVEAAARAAGLLLDVHVVDGGLRRVSLGGRAGAPAGTLEDHGDVVEGLLALYAATGEPRWAQAASELVDQVRQRFWDGATGFSDTAYDAPDPLLAAAGGRRPADPADNAYPSGVAAAAGALLSWSALSGDAASRDAAERALALIARVAASSPRFAGWGLAVAEAALDGPREVAVVGPLDDPATRELWDAALHGTAPGLVVAAGEPGTRPAVPLLEQRDLVDGRPAAYACRAMVCDLPTSDPARLRAFVGPGAEGLD
ncbi:thioredoxin domain-containing protein [Angustibacter luteus]|uniref:Thioredoxin domain-containing protein n=1 Tax=Angustibacter luteus TaxID=658456 RepID=A0ABW1JJ71_9ACTN